MSDWFERVMFGLVLPLMILVLVALFTALTAALVVGLWRGVGV